MFDDIKLFNRQEIEEMILCLDSMYNATATGYANELDKLVGSMSPYNDGDELTEDDADLIDTINNFLGDFNN